jgi:hypothetical protein
VISLASETLYYCLRKIRDAQFIYFRILNKGEEVKLHFFRRGRILRKDASFTRYGRIFLAYFSRFSVESPKFLILKKEREYIALS